VGERKGKQGFFCTRIQSVEARCELRYCFILREPMRSVEETLTPCCSNKWKSPPKHRCKPHPRRSAVGNRDGPKGARIATVARWRSVLRLVSSKSTSRGYWNRLAMPFKWCTLFLMVSEVITMRCKWSDK